MATKQFKIGLSNAEKQAMAQDVYERLLALTFPEYDTTTSYEVGDFVVYNDQLYKCIGATSGAWDSTKWQLATLNDLLTDIESAVAFVNDKANVDGNYPTMTVGVADQLSPYDDESGDDQYEPFSFQATGTGNGTQPDFSTGSIALMKEKQGNTVVVNQLVQNGNFASSSGWGTYQGSRTIANNKCTFLASASYGYVKQDIADIINGHSYIICATITLTTQTDKVLLGLMSGYNIISNSYKRTSGNVLKETLFISFNATQNYSSTKVLIQDERASDWDNVIIENVFVCDLTQWFNGDIPQDLLDNPENFFRYYQGSLAYNTGELVNANGRYIKCIGMNQCDEVFEGGGIGNSGADAINAYAFRTKNYLSVIPNQAYHLHANPSLSIAGYYFYEYDKDKNFIKRTSVYYNNQVFTIQPNTCYVRFFFYKEGTTWEANPPSKETAQVVLSLYYEDEGGYDQYYPYEVLTNNDTGTEVLRSAGSVKDYKTPDGVVHRLVGVVDLGTLTWVESGTSGIYYAEVSDALGNYGTYGTTQICSKYASTSSVYDNDKSCKFGNSSKNINISDSAFAGYTVQQVKSALSGVYLFYELATETTEQGTPYSENLVIDDFGSMDFSGTNGVPQGNLIFYPVDYKAFIDTLYNYTEGTPSNIALKSDLTGLVAQVDLSSGIVDKAGLTYDVKKCYKTGNTATLTIIATNETGSDISADTQLFALPSSVSPTVNNVFIVRSSSSISSFVVISGDVRNNETIANNGKIFMNVSYAIA